MGTSPRVGGKVALAAPTPECATPGRPPAPLALRGASDPVAGAPAVGGAVLTAAAANAGRPAARGRKAPPATGLDARRLAEESGPSLLTPQPPTPRLERAALGAARKPLWANRPMGGGDSDPTVDTAPRLDAPRARRAREVRGRFSAFVKARRGWTRPEPLCRSESVFPLSRRRCRVGSQTLQQSRFGCRHAGTPAPSPAPSLESVRSLRSAAAPVVRFTRPHAFEA